MRRIIALLGFSILMSAVRAQSLETIELQNRPAEEVIPIVEPMLGADDAISGEGFRIFLRSSPDTLARVREMIDVLDTPARILQVSVFQGSERDLRALGIDATISIESGDASDSTTYSTAGGSASVDGISTRRSLKDNPIHQVRVTEGIEAYVETGEQIPYFASAAWIGPRGIAAGVEYKDAVTGFHVLPRIRGDNVVLAVSPYKNARNRSGDIDTQSASTTVTGRIGEWLLIGGITEQQEQAQRSPGSTASTRSSKDTSIWIRADLVQ